MAALLVVLGMLPMGDLAQAKARPGDALAVVKPAISCDALGKTDISGAVGVGVSLQQAALKTTDKGSYCVVTGQIAPAIRFEVDLPMEHWTQRLLQEGCGGLCGNVSTGVDNAGTCLPALNGELVVSTDNLGHDGGDGAFGADPQKRIDFAYRANHLTALASKALIRALYGRPQRYAYFMGCSDGGREALIEAQRYPQDFDGVSAGDPAAMFQTQNSFYGAWSADANKRADGAPILLAAKGQLIHDAVLAECDTLSGVKDGLLQDPRACRFEAASLLCPPSASDTAKCLTPEEATVLQKLYDGAGDGAGHLFTFPAERGGEAYWHLPASAAPAGPGMDFTSTSIANVILPEVSPADGDVSKFAFTQANFDRMAQLAPLYNGLNTNLKPFAAHGGKLLVWHGWSDTAVTPEVSIAYYRGVQTYMGSAQTDAFLRLFLIPGMGHCQGGDGYDRFDVLTPLMAWVEHGVKPAKLLTGKRKPAPQGQGGGGGMNGPPKMVPGIRPIPAKEPDLVATRPVYPFPYLPHYVGQGDPNDATNYVQIKSPVARPWPFAGNVATSLIGPNNQKRYAVKDGRLAVVD
ncbi:MAG TPA: tannase/feruloyl esterase family alpha/beta hydrolase [Caulobacteraceae bacterium]|nr:tannase/feruloyl esterase family alpha/beta hydrolase [Caulobacteraceae bacterium]